MATDGQAASERLTDDSYEASSDAAGDAEGGAARDLMANMEHPWANSKEFVADVIALALLAAAMGAISWAYMKVVSGAPEEWLGKVQGKDYPREPESIDLLKGSPLWIPLIWLGCTLVGCLKAVLGLDKYSSFMKDLQTRKVHPPESAKAVVCCLATLLCGAAMGPEAGLASAGGFLGDRLSLLVGKLCPSLATSHIAVARRELYTLAGSTGAFGAILPAPWVSCLLVVELAMRKGDEIGSSMVSLSRRSVCLLGLVASLSWTVKYAIEPTVIAPLPNNMHDLTFTDIMPVQALGLGCIAALAAFIYLIIAGVCQGVFAAISRRVESCLGQPGRIVCMASLAGLLTGVIGWLVPLGLLDGDSQIIPTLQSCKSHHIKTPDLVAIGFGKVFAYWIAAAGGLVGGVFFPLLYYGIIVGVLVARLTGLNGQFVVPVMMSSVPAAIVACPFALVALPLSMFNLGPKWCVPMFVGVLVSYLLFIGTGFMRGMLSRAR